MQVFALIGAWDYEGSELLGVFATEYRARDYVEGNTWGYDTMYCVKSTLGELGSEEVFKYRRPVGGLIGE